jgi:uncharacterized protein YjiS (DUF1127 family)
MSSPGVHMLQTSSTPSDTNKDETALAHGAFCADKKRTGFSHEIRLAATERSFPPITTMSDFASQCGHVGRRDRCVGVSSTCRPSQVHLPDRATPKRPKRILLRNGANIISLGAKHYVFDHPHWGNVAAQFAESRRCIRSCYEVMRLNERDLADMRLTSLDARSEMQKPFWET